MASGVYELLILAAVVLIATFPFLAIVGDATSGWKRHLLQVWVLSVAGAYLVGFWTRGGQTLAMKTWRIRLVAKDGHARLPPKAALLRFVYALLLMPTLIGIAWAYVDRDRQFLHDRLAGSLLIPVP